MKTLLLTITMFVMFIFLGLGLESAHADNANGVYIQDIQVQPSSVKVGETFTVSATLVNNSTFPIYVDGGKCSAQDKQAELFTTTLDNHVKNKAENINCAGVGWSQLLDPGKSITVSNPDYTNTYIATVIGTATITVKFSYHSIIQKDPIQTSDEQTISKTFQFQIHDVNSDSSGPPITMPKMDPPLQQFKSGTAIQDITCSKTDGKQTYLFLRAENHDPVCITSNAEDKLSRRGFIETNQTVINQIVLKKAREFVLSSDTFENHGIKDSLSLDLKTCDLIVPQSCYPQAYFQVNGTGSYGNGTNSIPMTSAKTSYHVMSMTILGMNHVQCAVVDGIWDEKNQKPLDKNDPLCGMWYGYKDGTG